MIHLAFLAESAKSGFSGKALLISGFGMALSWIGAVIAYSGQKKKIDNGSPEEFPVFAIVIPICVIVFTGAFGFLLWGYSQK